MSDLLTPELCRAGRGLLNWTRSQLADAAGVSLSAISEFERSERTTYAATKSKIQSALEAGGVVFLAVGKIEGVGVERKP